MEGRGEWGGGEGGRIPRRERGRGGVNLRIKAELMLNVGSKDGCIRRVKGVARAIDP